jgi:DNA-binding HxlR family transcriptional regulator
VSRSSPRAASERATSGHATPGVDLPLAGLLDVLGRRFSLAVFWNLRAGSRSFRTLAASLDAPPTQLTQRTRELREAGLIEVDEAGDYRLTALGRRLLGLLEPLADWADEWSALSPRQRVPRGSADRGAGEP